MELPKITICEDRYGFVGQDEDGICYFGQNEEEVRSAFLAEMARLANEAKRDTITFAEARARRKARWRAALEKTAAQIGCAGSRTRPTPEKRKEGHHEKEDSHRENQPDR